MDGYAAAAGVAAAVVAAAIAAWMLSGPGRRSRGGYRPPPAVPGLPLVGNLLQLKEKQPYQAFASWAEIYGPIYTIKTGASTLVVLNSAKVAKEAMIAKFDSISTRKLSNALTVLTSNKTMVATSDYGEFHRMVKRFIISGVLGTNAQKQFRHHRDALLSNLIGSFHTAMKNDPHSLINFREIFKNELFRLALVQALGEDVESVYVEKFGKVLSKGDMYKVLVSDMMAGAIDVDWRDFFPYLRWVPNRSLEARVQMAAENRTVLMRALIMKERATTNQRESNCYLDSLLSENTLKEDEVLMLVWEAIIESSDSTAVVAEWAMYELAKNADIQGLLFQEIKEVCGDAPVSEEDLPRLPYLNAVFHETLRRHTPVPLIPVRYVHEDTQIGGYDIPAGNEIAINLYACNMNKDDWEDPGAFRPERFLSGKSDHTDFHKTMAFGAGKRACAGSLQAMLVACMSIARLIQEFVVALGEGEEDDVDTVQLTALRLHPLNLSARVRP